MRTRRLETALLLTLLALPIGCAAADSQDPPRVAELRPDGSITVYPVLLAGRPFPEAATAVGTLLEKAGVDDVEVAGSAFEPAKDATFDDQAAAFAEHVKAHPPKTDYAMLTAIHGTPGEGVDSIRTVMSDRQGNIVFLDEQSKDTQAFRAAQPKDPLSSCIFAVRRLQGPMQLKDPLRPGAKAGKLAERAREAAGIPDDSEFAAMEERSKLVKKTSTVTVYPVRIVGEYSKEAAQQLADLVNEKGLMAARVAEEKVPFDVQGSPNQQVVLWSAAHSLQASLKKAPPTTDYALFAVFMVREDDQPARLVHTYLFDKAGGFVVVDFQNSHHDDFLAVNPKNREDCVALAAKRLARLLD